MSNRRDIQVPWTCSRTGHCCATTGEVRVTVAERETMERVAPTATMLSWRADADPHFVRLQAGPCPLLQPGASFSVYADRPFVCRSFICGRVDVTTQPYQVDEVTGCGDLTARP